ncbi:MAG: nickel-dependent lactate racemase [Pirellulaceae bacterium]|jgi:nickel-dependent lactate racemase|nr:nickel-dependent lactate racemase [Pirellulaceae bacterium]
MQYQLRYGRGLLEVGVPDDAQVTCLRKPPMPPLSDERAAVLDALALPVDSPDLAQLARGARSACIAICDITRPVPNQLFLRPMIETMLAAGMPASKITVLVATGLHRPNEGAELEELLGDPWVQQTVAVENHFARDDAQHVLLGTTSKRGTVVRIDRRFVEAELRIATGLVEPHFMAGYSGGRKVIAPGLAHAETITTFHSSRFMADPAAANCNFVGNPLHEEQMQIIEMLGGALALNTVIDEDRRLAFVNFGEIVASHMQAVDFTREYCELPVKQQFKTVVTCAAGYPLDKTYYQTIKGMVGAIEILAPGGDLIIASECSEGMGSEEFAHSQQRLVESGTHDFLQHILKKSHASIDEWQTQMQLKPMSLGTIHLYSDGLPVNAHHLTGVHCIDSVDQAIVQSLARHSSNSLAIIPEGPYVVPFYRPHAPLAV